MHLVNRANVCGELMLNHANIASQKYLATVRLVAAKTREFSAFLNILIF